MTEIETLSSINLMKKTYVGNIIVSINLHRNNNIVKHIHAKEGELEEFARLLSIWKPYPSDEPFHGHESKRNHS